MEATEFTHHLRHIHSFSASGPIEIRAIFDGLHHVILWRKTPAAAKRCLGWLRGECRPGGFIVRRAGRVALYNADMAFIRYVKNTDGFIPESPAPDWSAMDKAASRLLTAAHRLSVSFPHQGAAVSLEANHGFAIAALAGLDKVEPHMLGVSDGKGAEALYLDVVSAPPGVQDWFLDHTRQLGAGEILDWHHYDVEMLHAFQSYRFDDFCDWTAQCAGANTTAAKVADVFSQAEAGLRDRMFRQAACALLPQLVYYIGADKGHPERLEPQQPVVLPQSLLRQLGLP